MLRNIHFYGLTTGNDVRYVNTWGWEMTVTVFLGPPIAPKLIRTTSLAIPSVVTSLYDSQTFERIYTQTLQAGDRELGFDQPTAYGKMTDTSAPFVEFTSFLFRTSLSTGTLGTLVGDINYEFAALWATP